MTSRTKSEQDGAASGEENVMLVWNEVTPVVALGDRLQNGMTYSVAADSICNNLRDTSKNAELVGVQQWNGASVLKMRSNKEILSNVDNIAGFVKVAKVTHPVHPAVILANLFREQGYTHDPGFTLFVNESVKKGTILGSVAGHVSTGREVEEEIASEQTGAGKMREMCLYDLEGSLKVFGGWVESEDRTTDFAEMLVLDTSKKTNILSFLQDIREDPFGTCAPPRNGFRGSANVRCAETRINNIPQILVVATRDIERNEELMIDIGNGTATAHRNIYRSAKNLHDLQKMINDLSDKNKELRDEYLPAVYKGVKDNEDVKSSRNAAVLMSKEWKDAEEDSDTDEAVPREELGCLFSTHLIGSLRKEVYDEIFDDEEECAEILSEHQSLIYDDSFIPKKPKEVETPQGTKKIIWVDNVDCNEFMSIQADHGQAIFNEVGRAWLESNELSDATGGKQVPWDRKKKRLLQNDEIIMTQTAKCMVLAGFKPSKIDDGIDGGELKKRKRKFRKIFEEVKKNKNEDKSAEPEEDAIDAARGSSCR